MEQILNELDKLTEYDVPVQALDKIIISIIKMDRNNKNLLELYKAKIAVLTDELTNMQNKT